MNTVRTYSFATRIVSEIPEAELSSDMVYGNVDGIGMVWVDAKDIEISYAQHAPLPPAKTRYLERIIRDIDTIPQETRDTFVAHPFVSDRELSIWRRIADVYLAYTKQHPMSPLKKRECYELILRCTLSASPSGVLETVRRHFLTLTEAENIIALYGDMLTKPVSELVPSDGFNIDPTCGSGKM